MADKKQKLSKELKAQVRQQIEQEIGNLDDITFAVSVAASSQSDDIEAYLKNKHANQVYKLENAEEMFVKSYKKKLGKVARQALALRLVDRVGEAITLANKYLTLKSVCKFRNADDCDSKDDGLNMCQERDGKCKVYKAPKSLKVRRKSCSYVNQQKECLDREGCEWQTDHYTKRQGVLMKPACARKVTEEDEAAYKRRLQREEIGLKVGKNFPLKLSRGGRLYRK
jgi:hypothetical protein